MDFDLLDPPLLPLPPVLRANKPRAAVHARRPLLASGVSYHAAFFAGDFGSCCGRVVASAPGPGGWGYEAFSRPGGTIIGGGLPDGCSGGGRA